MFYPRAILAAVVFSISQPLYAQIGDRTGFAMNAGIGQSVIRDTDGTDEFDANAFAYILGVEYRFVPKFAVGINVFSLGTGEDFFDGVDTEIDVGGVDLVGRLILPLADSVELYGLFGGAVYSADLEPGGAGGLFGEGAVALGAGLDFDTSENFSLRVEGRYYDGTRQESGGLLTAGFSFRF